MELPRLRDALLRVSKPYSNLYHPDGSLYMERSLVIQRRGEEGAHLRLHHICTEDRDKHLHDHPFSFWSWVLTGGYIEARPLTRNPCFFEHRYFSEGGRECYEGCNLTFRYAGSLSYRHACDRHRIVHVMPDTWTLVLAGPLRQWWGFYTQVGKIHHEDYASVHSTTARSERA